MKQYALNLIAFLFLVTALPAVSGPEPETPDPQWEHDKWNTQPKDHVWKFGAYTASFDGPDDNDGDGESDKWGIPEWVSYEIKRGPVKSTLTDRPPWHTIPEWYDDGFAPDDESYKYPAGTIPLDKNYDRGHMCMREIARRISSTADHNSHSIVNACPQIHPFNNGIWKGLEFKTMDWADEYGSVWVICGPIVLNASGVHKPSKWIGEPGEFKVAIPQKFFKIVVKESSIPNRPDVLAFIYPHDAHLNSASESVDHRPYLHSVREIEEATGLDFFTALSTADQDAIETVAATELWSIGGGDNHAFARSIRVHEDLSDQEIDRSQPEPRVEPGIGNTPDRGFGWRIRRFRMHGR